MQDSAACMGTHGVHQSNAVRNAQALNMLQMKIVNLTHRHPARRMNLNRSLRPMKSSSNSNPINCHHRSSRSSPLIATAAGSTNYPLSSSTNNNNNDDWNILDAPGLTPPRSEFPKTDPVSRFSHFFISLLSTFIPALGSVELLRRAGVTLCMLVCVRIGHYIPVPGLNLSAIMSYIASNPVPVQGGNVAAPPLPLPPGSASPQTMPLSMMSLMTGSQELPGNMFLLSITPYMTAHLTISALQLIPEFRKQMNQLRDQGRQGREVINNYLNSAFVLCAVVQALVESNALVGIASATTAGWWFKLQTGVTLMAGAVICKFAVQTVEQWGLGDGTGVVIGAGIALSYFKTLLTVVSILIAAPPHPAALAAAVGIIFSLLALVVWVQGIELRLPLTFFSSRRSSAQSNHPVLRILSRGVDSRAALDAQQLLPLRLSPAGTRQLLFASFWISTLAAPLQFIGVEAHLLSNPWVFAALVFLLEAVSIADATPRQAADFLAQSDTGIQGLSPGVDTERFLSTRRKQMKFLNAAFIAWVSLAARAVDGICAGLIGVPLGCLNLLLLVSTVLGGARQVDALSQGPKVERMIAEEYSVLEEIAQQRRSDVSRWRSGA
jgi:preprotein translocase subunit SecY